MDKEKDKKIKADKAEEIKDKETETKAPETVLKTEYDGKVEELTELSEDYKDKWYRVSAEFANYKKRVASESANAYVNGKADTVRKILPIGDNLERALSMPLDDVNRKGIEMLLKSFKEVCKDLGVEEINPEGQVFDPNVAEAVMQAEPQENDVSGNVKAVFEKGYKYGDKIIRYAKVSVIK